MTRPMDPFPPALDRAAGGLHRRAVLALYAGALARHLTAALLLAGSAALMLRFFAELPRAAAAPVLVALALAPLTAWLAVRRSLLTPAGAHAWLDLRAGGSGLLLTALELRDERWSQRAAAALSAAPGLPPLRGQRLFAPILPALLFAAAVFWVDVPRAGPGPSAALFDAALETLEEKLATLEEVVELEEQKAEELEGRLDRLGEETDLARPEAAFEALDALEEALEQEAAEALERARESLESLAEARRELASGNPDEGTRQQLEQTLAALAESGFSSAMTDSLLEELTAAGLELSAEFTLDASRLAELSEELQRALGQQLAGLEEVGLLQPGELAEALDLEALELLELTEAPACEECEGGGT